MQSASLIRLLALAAPLALAACSATSTANEAAAPSAVPTEVNSDDARRAIYNANAPVRPANTPQQPIPDATPNTQRLGEQAAGTNTYKRPETLNTNAPNNTPTETRMQDLDRSNYNTQPQP